MPWTHDIQLVFMQCTGRQLDNICYLSLISLSKYEACDCYCHLVLIDLSKKRNCNCYCYLIRNCLRAADGNHISTFSSSAVKGIEVDPAGRCRSSHLPLVWAGPTKHQREVHDFSTAVHASVFVAVSVQLDVIKHTRKDNLVWECLRNGSLRSGIRWMDVPLKLARKVSICDHPI